jgi:hypothetical protein
MKVETYDNAEPNRVGETTPDDLTGGLNRRDAGRYLKARYGVGAHGTLAKLAMTGDDFGRRARRVYRIQPRR